MSRGFAPRLVIGLRLSSVLAFRPGHEQDLGTADTAIAALAPLIQRSPPCCHLSSWADHARLSSPVNVDVEPKRRRPLGEWPHVAAANKRSAWMGWWYTAATPERR